jgi:lysophospholipase L1-like esterase
MYFHRDDANQLDLHLILVEMQKAVRVLVLGDSLSLPRNKPEVVSFEETWPFLLSRTGLFEIIQISIGGGTLYNLLEQSDYYLPGYPDIVIIQSGIVDCAPRAIGFIEKEIIRNCRVLNFLVRKLYPYRFMRKYRNITYTKPAHFTDMVNKMIMKFSDKRTIWIGIIPAVPEYENHLPGISKNIDQYNATIQSIMTTKGGTFLDTANLPLNGLMSDHHHLNAIGHSWIFNQLFAELSKIEKQTL